MTALICFLAANLACAVLLTARDVPRGRRRLVWFFIFLPGLGFVVYYVPRLLLRRTKRTGIRQSAAPGTVPERIRLPERPHMQTELDVVPVEDALAVSSAADRKNLLRTQLGRNPEDNYRLFLAAERGSDAEAAAAVAAARTVARRQLETRWLESKRAYEQHADEPEAFHAASQTLWALLTSNTLSDSEQQAFAKEFCNLMQRRISTAEADVTQTEYEEYLRALVDLRRNAEAENLWRRYAEQIRSENTYRSMLKLYYQMGDRHKLEDMLNDLRRNRQVRLSAEGLELLRYWTKRLNWYPEHG